MNLKIDEGVLPRQLMEFHEGNEDKITMGSTNSINATSGNDNGCPGWANNGPLANQTNLSPPMNVPAIVLALGPTVIFLLV
jgi:hypothetical protein